MKAYSSQPGKVFFAKDFGIFPQEEISESLAAFLLFLQKEPGNKVALFEKGTYYIDARKCQTRMLYITNTVGDQEFCENEVPHLNTLAMLFEETENLTFDGNDSIFVIDGKASNAALIRCKNIILQNLEIRHAHPDMHEFKVLAKNAHTVDFQLDADTLYQFENGKLFFYGSNYKTPADKNADFADWIGLIKEQTPDNVKRVLHPLAHYKSISEIGNHQIRVTYEDTARFTLGDCFYFYDVRRQFAGIFMDSCANVSLVNVKQRFNYSLAVVAQNCENILMDQIDFSPEKGSARKIVSAADFIQLCMCRGQVLVQNSHFKGAQDDCLNVHGIHFIITEKAGNKIAVRFMHPQTHGFNPLRVGDEIAFIHPETLLEKGRAMIEASCLLNEYEIELTLSNADTAMVNDAIEDISACPEVIFSNNTLNRIITRGLLITTRGKVLIENNHFINTTMSSILLSDDAKGWFESGMCLDVTIRNNRFDECGETPILILPENRKHEGAVHRNIRIMDNVFSSYKSPCIYAKSVNQILIEGNHFSDPDYLETKNCAQILNIPS